MADLNEEYLTKVKSLAEQQAKSSKSAYDTIYNANLENYKAQIPTTQKAYDEAKSTAYSTSRVSALGNEEQLANVGLSGGAYKQATSGYGETSRIQQDIALQNNLNALSSEERSAVQSLQTAMRNLGTQRVSDFAGIDQTAQSTIGNAELGVIQSNIEQQAIDKQNLEAQQANFAEIEAGLTSGTMDLTYAKQLSKTPGAGGISEEQYNTLVTNNITTSLNSGDFATATDTLNTAKQIGAIDDATYTKYKTQLDTKTKTDLATEFGTDFKDEGTANIAMDNADSAYANGVIDKTTYDAYNKQYGDYVYNELITSWDSVTDPTTKATLQANLQADINSGMYDYDATKKAKMQELASGGTAEELVAQNTIEKATGITSFTASSNDKNINEVSNNASRQYEFKVGEETFEIKAQSDKKSAKLTSKALNTEEDTTSKLSNLGNNEFLYINGKGNTEYVVYKENKDNFIIFMKGASINSTSDNKAGFNKLKTLANK